jgi:hypothetical protein
MCPFTDGMCYTSNPPKRKCALTDEFHYYDDECNCEYLRLLKEKEKTGESLIERFPDSAIMINTDNIAASEYEFPDTITEYICEPITTIGTPCLICGETVFVDVCGSGPKVCDSCRKAIQFVKDNLMEKKDD